MCRPLNYKVDSIAGRDEEEYVGHFYFNGIPDDEKPDMKKGDRVPDARLPIAPEVVDWVDEHAPPRSEDDNEWTYSFFETCFAGYLMDWYFMELGHCLLENDSEED